MNMYKLNFDGQDVAKLFLDGGCELFGDYSIVDHYYRNKKNIQEYEVIGKITNNLYCYDDFDDQPQTVYAGDTSIPNNPNYYNDLQVASAHYVFRCHLNVDGQPEYVYVTIKHHNFCNISFTGSQQYKTLSTINFTDESEFNCNLNNGLTDSQELLNNIIHTYCEYAHIKPINNLTDAYCYAKFGDDLETPLKI